MSLTGKTVLVTRAKGQAHELSALIEQNGGRAIEVPLIAFEAVEDNGRLDDAMAQLSSYKWLIFTSVNGVHFFMKRYKERFRNKMALPVSIAVVGEKTEAALWEYNVKADVVPTDYTAEGMVDVLVSHIEAGDRVLLARGNRGRHVLNDALAKIGAHLEDITIYKTTFPPVAKKKLNLLVEKQVPIDYVTFTSSSTVTHYVELVKQFRRQEALLQPKIACIGPIAANTARKLGLSVEIVPSTYTINALVEQLVKDSGGGEWK